MDLGLKCIYLQYLTDQWVYIRSVGLKFLGLFTDFSNLGLKFIGLFMGFSNLWVSFSNFSGFKISGFVYGYLEFAG